MFAYDIHANELRPLGHGEPLWIPESLTDNGGVQIGDVGFMDGGRFKRLFNALEDETHDWNRVNGCPEGIAPMQYAKDCFLSKTADYLAEGIPICSRSVYSVAAQASATLAQKVELSYAFQCERDQGAVVVPGSAPTEERVVQCAEFPNYMSKHYKAWHSFARGKNYSLEIEDLVFVYGWVKTDTWAIATVESSNGARMLSLSAQGNSFVDASFSLQSAEGTTTMPQCRTSAKRSEGDCTKDQCLFLRCYKMKKLLRFGPRYPKAQAEPLPYQRWDDTEDPAAIWVNDSSSSTGDGEHYEVIDIAEPNTKSDDPLDTLLDLILENTSAEYAIACHDDLYKIFPREEWPNNFACALRAAQQEGRLMFKVNDCNVGYLALSPSPMSFSETQPDDYALNEPASGELPADSPSPGDPLAERWPDNADVYQALVSSSKSPANFSQASGSRSRSCSPAAPTDAPRETPKKRGRPAPGKRDPAKKRTGAKKATKSTSSTRERRASKAPLAVQLGGARKKRAVSSAASTRPGPSISANQAPSSPPPVLRVESLTQILPVPVMYTRAGESDALTPQLHMLQPFASPQCSPVCETAPRRLFAQGSYRAVSAPPALESQEEEADEAFV
ncbi:hypothetical protein PsYK624_004660 [Phanerochaete sordida]|uniref:Uncharacterized protein n=1 Tax=Phanerochaete sordida TaxID=48140 RepID=A0A9P3FY71_9APHY|nr:hypothetical protein PsYK624_004660 [Phanerochaete sordida]